MATLQFLGAAGTVTGSKYLLEAAGERLMIDCGLFQGEKELRLRNWSALPVPPSSINWVVLTHAHLDHTGYLPRLVKDCFRGPIWGTPATVELARLVLPDSGHLQEEDAAFHNKRKSSKHTPALPLYTFQEAQECMKNFRAVEFGETQQLQPGFGFRFVRAAHIVGSSMVEVTLGSQRLLFTGDIGRVHDSQIAPGRVVHSGPTEGESADLLVMESTYGNRLHPTSDPRPELAKLISDTAKRGVAVLQCYATAELGVIAYESEAREGMIVNETVILEIVRPGTGDPMAEGEVGEVVVTSFNPDYPMIRLGTGDMSTLMPGVSPCGRTNARIKGWMGRADQTAKVKGMFVHPKQVAEIAARHPALNRLRLVVGREAEQDTMTLLAESTASNAALTEAVAATLQSVTKLKGTVTLVAPGSLPNDGKVIADERPA